MNIAKHKETLRLKEELFALEKEYQAKQSDMVDAKTGVLLSAAVKEFIEFLNGEGFEIEGDENDTFTASSDGVLIRAKRYPRIFTVNMPNGEEYNVGVESTLEFVKYRDEYGMGQDAEIESLKKGISKVKEQLDLIDNQKFRYVMDSGKSTFGIKSKRPYLTFEAALKEMFS